MKIRFYRYIAQTLSTIILRIAKSLGLSREPSKKCQKQNIFFNFYLAVPRPTLGHYREDSLTHPMLITAFLHFRPEGHLEPRSEVGSLSPAERLVGFEPGALRFSLQRLNPIGHSPQERLANIRA